LLLRAVFNLVKSTNRVALADVKQAPSLVNRERASASNIKPHKAGVNFTPAPFIVS
jgi:hypothetical protein